MTFTQLTDRLLEAAVLPSFTRLGYAARARLEGWDHETPAPLDGRTLVLTGATSGIGRAAALALAGRGARLFVVGRNPDRTAHACAEVGAAADNDDVHPLIADLSEPTQVRDVAHRLRDREVAVDALIHNAGALHASFGTNRDGIERTFAAQVLGPFVLTSELLPALRAAPSPRVITVSSGGMYTECLDVDTVVMAAADYQGTTAYARAKRAQVELNRAWARREPGIAFHAMHPGWAATPGLAHSLPGFARLLGPLLRTPAEGADTVVWLATAPDALLSTGDFWFDRHRRPVHRLPWTVSPPSETDRLWHLLSRLSEETREIPEPQRKEIP